MLSSLTHKDARDVYILFISTTCSLFVRASHQSPLLFASIWLHSFYDSGSLGLKYVYTCDEQLILHSTLPTFLQCSTVVIITKTLLPYLYPSINLRSNSKSNPQHCDSISTDYNKSDLLENLRDCHWLLARVHCSTFGFKSFNWNYIAVRLHLKTTMDGTS